MKLPITIHRARLGSAEFKVIRPARPLTHAALIDHDRHLNAYLDQDAAQQIGGLRELAASSPRALVHLPMRSNPTPFRNLPEAGTRQLDLVLLHHSLQFAPSRWKELRGRLGPDRGAVIGSDAVFSWGVWVSLSCENFVRAADRWDAAGREAEEPSLAG